MSGTTSPVPTTMRAAVIDRAGGPEVLTIQTVPVPKVGSTDVLIALDTAGVASWDAEMRDGWSPEGRPKYPLILGTDGAGIVAAVGSRVRRVSVGDAVYAYDFSNPKGGFYAEYIAIAAALVARVPDGLELEQAGAMPAIGLTALQGIDDALRLKRGESIIVLGASGGLGILAVQIAKWRGARVLAIASGRDGVTLARRLAADEAVDGRRADITAAARRFAPDGVDAAIAFAGGPPLTRCLDALRRGGRLAYPNGIEPEPRRRRGIEFVAYDAEPGARPLDRLGKAIDGAGLHVPIVARFPLERVGDAHERLAAGHVPGKIVLRPRL